MFVDASAWYAILLDEPEKDALLRKIAEAPEVFTSPVAVWETVRAVLRQKRREPEAARREVQELIRQAKARLIPIGADESEAALDAMIRFGKGRHKAALNLGDCFAYACARTHRAKLLYKGADFALTDAEAA